MRNDLLTGKSYESQSSAAPAQHSCPSRVSQVYGCLFNTINNEVDFYMVPLDALWDYGQGELIVVGSNSTAGIFATYPSKHLTLVNGFFDQVA